MHRSKPGIPCLPLKIRSTGITANKVAISDPRNTSDSCRKTRSAPPILKWTWTTHISISPWHIQWTRTMHQQIRWTPGTGRECSLNRLKKTEHTASTTATWITIPRPKTRFGLWSDNCLRTWFRKFKRAPNAQLRWTRGNEGPPLRHKRSTRRE